MKPDVKQQEIKDRVVVSSNFLYVPSKLETQCKIGYIFHLILLGIPSSSILGYSRKKTMGLEDILSEKSSGIFGFVTLTLEIPEKTSFHSWKFCKIV